MFDPKSETLAPALRSGASAGVRNPKFLMWLSVALVAAAFALRVRNLGVSDLTFDEAATAFISAKPYPEMLKYLLGAFHELPPAYYALMRAWESVAGRGEFALRYPSVMFGALGVALIYRIGRRGLGTGAGVIAALLLTLQPFHAYYSQDARMYTLMPLEAMAMIYFFDRLCREPRLRWWLAFGATGGLAVLTHYFMGFVVAALCVYLLLHWRAHWRMTLPWFGGLAAAGIVMVAWLVTSRAGRLVWRTLNGITWRGFIKRLAPAQKMFSDIIFGFSLHLASEWRWLIAALLALGLLAAILSRRWRTLRPGGAWLLPAWLIIPPLLLIITPERLEARYNAAIVPAYCLVLALAVAWLWQWKKFTRPLAPVALGLLLYAQVATLIPTMSVVKSDYGHVIAYLRRHARPGDSLIVNGDWQWVQLAYYPAPQLPTFRLPPSTPPGLDPAQARPELEKALSSSKRIWLLTAALDETDPQRFVTGWLNEHAYATSGYKELSLYTVGAASVAPQSLGPPVLWDDVLRLESVRWTQSQATPGEPLLLDLNWRVLRAPQRDLGLTLRLADRDGGVWYFNDVALGQYYAPSSAWQAGQRIIARVGIPIPLGAPPGEYEVRVGLAELQTNTGDDYVTLTGAQVLACSRTNPCITPLESEGFKSLGVTFGDRLALVGYQLGGDQVLQGRFAAVTLYWRPERALSEDVTERIALVDRAGRVVAQTEGPPVAAWYPSSQWTPGELVADPLTILVPPKVPPGDYSFRVSLFTPDGHALSVSGKEWLDVGHIRVLARERQFRAGPISRPLSVTFGDKARLLGYDVKKPANQQEVKLTLYWQAMQEMDKNYTVFRHVVGPGGKPVGQKDSWPREGDYPTSFWMRGEVVTDEVVIPFSTETGPGEYRIELGLYDAATLERLAAVSNGARMANDAVVIPLSVER